MTLEKESGDRNLGLGLDESLEDLSIFSLIICVDISNSAVYVRKSK